MSNLANLLEEFEDYQDSYAEYEDVIGDADIEAREVHTAIGKTLRNIGRAIDKLRRADTVRLEDVEDIEDRLARLSDRFSELAANL